MPASSSPDWMSTRPRLLWASAKSGPEPDRLRGTRPPPRGCRRPAGRARGPARCAPRPGPGSWRDAPAGARPWRRAQSGVRRRRRGEVQPGLELSQRLVELARPQVGDSEVDVDGGGGRQERDRALQARPRPARSPVSRSAVPRNAWLAPAAGSSSTALAQLGQGPVPGAAVPQGDAEAVVGLGRLGPEGDGPLQVGEGPGRSPCWPRTKPSRLCASAWFSSRRRASRELLAGVGQLAARRRPRGRARTAASAGLGRRARAFGRARALLLRSAIPSA